MTKFYRGSLGVIIRYYLRPVEEININYRKQGKKEMQNIDNPLANNCPHNNFNHLLALMLIVDTRILSSKIPYVNILRKKTANYVLLIFSLIT